MHKLTGIIIHGSSSELVHYSLIKIIEKSVIFNDKHLMLFHKSEHPILSGSNNAI